MMPKGMTFSLASSSIIRSSSFPARSCRRSFSRVVVCCSCCSCWSSVEPSAVVDRTGGRSRSRSRSSARAAAFSFTCSDTSRLDHVDADLGQVADDGIHVAPHVAHFRELRRLDLEERGVHEPREPAGDLGLAHARGADHDDVLRHHLVAQVLGQTLAPPAVPERDGHGALGLVLADDVFVQFLDDLARASGCLSKKPPREANSDVRSQISDKSRNTDESSEVPSLKV